MRLFKSLLVIGLVAAAFAGGLGYARWSALPANGGGPADAGRAATVRYRCPMHPNYVSDNPGTCPICGMSLVPFGEGGGAPSAGAPVTTGVVPPPGSIRVSAEKQQLIGVTYDTVRESNSSRTIRAVGAVAIDDTRVVKIHPRIEGWVERVFADATGRFVNSGQPLLTIYSPDVLAAQQEFLLALRNQEDPSADALTRAQNDSLVAAARKRLELWDLSEAQIQEVERTKVPITATTLLAPAAGHIMTRTVYPKQRVTADTELYTVADLSQVWVLANVFEQDAPFIRQGLPADITVSYTGRTISARVVLVEPQVDAATRTLKVRLSVPNPGFLLKPDMFVDVAFQIREGRKLTVPLSAVLDSGARKTVFVDRGNGLLEPRQVTTGEITGDQVEVLTGLSEGERIVTSGNFLLDSESQMKAVTDSAGTGDNGGARHD